MPNVKIGSVNQFPPNLFQSENLPQKGSLVYGYDQGHGGDPGLGNRWYRLGFEPGATWDSIGDSSKVRVLEAGGYDPSNGGSLGAWGSITAHGTQRLRSQLPALEGASVDSAGDVYIDSSKAYAATGNGKYGQYNTGQGMGGPGAPSLPPPPPTSLQASGQGAHVWELSVGPDGNSWWAAKTPTESAHKSDANPHSSYSILNPEMVAGFLPPGTRPLDLMDVDEYVTAGWSGFKLLLAYQPDGTVTVASDEVRQAMDSALQGNVASQKVLTHLGIKPPPKSSGVGLEAELLSLFGMGKTEPQYPGY